MIQRLKPGCFTDGFWQIECDGWRSDHGQRERERGRNDDIGKAGAANNITLDNADHLVGTVTVTSGKDVTL